MPSRNSDAPQREGPKTSIDAGPLHNADADREEVASPLRHEQEVPADAAGKRLDVYWTQFLPGVSRARVGRSIDAGLAWVDGRNRKASYRLSAGEKLVLEVQAEAPGPIPEAIALDILFEDEAIAVVNKPPGMVVHPAKGHWSGTLASALAAHFQQLSGVGGAARPGIVHRLDRDTSGVIVIAKTDASHQALADQFQARSVEKRYLAIVAGAPDRDRDRINVPIGPHPSQREKKAIRADHPESRQAETFYEVVERFRGFALVHAEPKTGRTHQIRLHLTHAGIPVLCDRLYGGRATLTAGQVRQVARCRKSADDLPDDEVVLGRQALHAQRLCFTHPVTGERLQVEAPMPQDLERLVALLRHCAASG